MMHADGVARARERAQLAHDVGWYAVSRGAPALLSLMSVWLLATSLGPAEYGHLGIAQAVANAAAMVACGWLSQGILRFGMPGDGAARSRPLALATGMAGAIGAGVALAAGFALGPPWAAAPAAAATTALTVALVAHTVIGATFQADLRPQLVAKVEVARAGVGALLIAVVCLRFDGGAVAGVTAVAASYATSAALGMWASARGAESSARRGGPPIGISRLVRFGAPMSAWFALSLAFPLVDRTAVEHLIGIEAAGRYAAIYDLAFRSSSLLLMPVVLALHPRVMRAADEARGASELLRAGLRAGAIIAGMVVALAALLGGLIVERTFGAAVDPTDRLVFSMLAASGCLWSLGLLAHKPLEVRGRTVTMVVLLGAALAAATAGNYLMIPRFGLLGAAGASLAAGALYVCGAMVLGAAPIDASRS